jgi:hypothetical protein
MMLRKHRPGRPQKYGRPSRAVTLTLPEDVIVRLQAIDADLGRAVVSIAEKGGRRYPRIKPAELATYGSHAVILVMPVKSLKRLPGVQLVPVGNGRALISFDPPESVAEFELYLRDALDRADLADAERTTLEALTALLREARQSQRVSIRKRTIIVLETKRERRARSKR